MSRIETIGNATLYLGDCMEILPTLGKVDAVITDPPYGINENSKKVASRGKLAALKDYGHFDWDKSPPPPELIEALRSASQYQAFFGGNYFQLPPSSCWLVWDKLNGDNDFADCELAWTSFKTAVRKFKWRWNGMLQEDMRHKEERIHPTQKPVPLFVWILERYSKPGDLVLDPFLGSGTTAIACLRTGRHYIGIEKHEPYFLKAQERIDKERAQVRLFDALGGVTA